jgi:hypothetical protein
LRDHREERQSQSRRVQGNKERRDTHRVGELREQREERQSQSRRIEGTEGGETIPE